MKPLILINVHELLVLNFLHSSSFIRLDNEKLLAINFNFHLSSSDPNLSPATLIWSLHGLSSSTSSS
ncbi:hypothetical protein RJT34_11729 [Clitoria ternatea]|uniref:Uncharacterized protein n=1 Tax=Clitoria ternatea TaxID=43366 RepID=A0AAN9JL12_CLITE